MAKKTEAATIYQGYQLQTDRNTRLAVRDKRGEWTRWTDSAIGLNRYVTVIATNNRTTVKEATHQQVGEIRTRSHGHMNDWLERKTKALEKRYGNDTSPIRILGAFASRASLETAGLHVLQSSGAKPIEWIQIYIETASQLNQARIGQYVIKIDMEDRGKDPERVGLLKAGAGNYATGYWDDYYHAVEHGISAFDDMRQKGHDLLPSHNAASKALGLFVQSLQPATAV